MSSPPPPPPDSASSSDNCSSEAEKAAEQVLNCIRPTLGSEKKRKGVIDYIQRLLKTRLDCQVLLIGSVPLKTYLPEGDIDLTALKGPHTSELAGDVVSVLEAEALNVNAEYQVRDIELINAEVKLVKCVIQDIVVDITFNQLDGLLTLCFLEQGSGCIIFYLSSSILDNIASMDNDSVFSYAMVAEINRIVGRSHLFKRSIILVKAWCSYESCILGAEHGLISTCALETLIMYIFRLFHSSLSGPLSVLHKFLEYYSQLDWETYGISVKGPVYVSSLPNIIVKIQENGWENLMLREEFLNNCIEMFSVPSRGLEEKPFQAKYLNIVDPLNKNNNTGRSVNKDNFYRIQSAFEHGAYTLGQILSRPSDEVGDGVRDLFKGTLAQHGSSISHLPLTFGSLTITCPVEFLSEDNMLTKPSVPDFDTTSLKFEAFDPLVDLCGDYDSHIRSLQHGQSCLWPTSSDPPTQNQFSHMNSPTMYIQHGNDSHRELPSQVTGRNGAPENNNPFQNHVRGNGRERNDLERSITHDVVPVRGRGRGRNNFERSITRDVLQVQGRGRGSGRNNFERSIADHDVLRRRIHRRRGRRTSDIHHQPWPSDGDVNQINDDSSGSN